MFSKCNHKWEVLKEETTESKMEYMLRLTGKSPSPTNESQLKELTVRKSITILCCSKCGKLNKTIEVI